MGLLLLEVMADARAPLHEVVADLQAHYGPTCYERTDFTLKAPVPKREWSPGCKGRPPPRWPTRPCATCSLLTATVRPGRR